jgi:hypothetical protein
MGKGGQDGKGSNLKTVMEKAHELADREDACIKGNVRCDNAKKLKAMIETTTFTQDGGPDTERVIWAAGVDDDYPDDGDIIQAITPAEGLRSNYCVVEAENPPTKEEHALKMWLGKGMTPVQNKYHIHCIKCVHESISETYTRACLFLGAHTKIYVCLRGMQCAKVLGMLAERRCW